MLNRVLVPLDGSPAAERALAILPAIPCRTIRLLRVCAPGTNEAEVLDDLAAVADRASATGWVVEIACLAGDPAEQIVAAANEADLIVMTSAGRGAGGRRFFGSVADRVTRHAPVPTLVVRAADDAPAPQVGRVVVPLDGSAVADRALAVARHVAGERPVVVVGVVEPGATDEAGHLARLEAAASGLREHVSAASTSLLRGEPATEVLALLAPDDLIVMTTHGGGGGQRWQIGHVAERIMRHAPGPVLLVRGDHAAP